MSHLKLVTPPPGPGPSTPSNAFHLGHLRRLLGSGRAELAVSVPGAGTVTLRGGAVLAKATSTVRATTVNLLVAPKGKVRRALRKTGKAKVKVTISYAPTGGTPSHRSKRLTLRRTVR